MRLTKKKILFRGDNWFVTPNDFPYSGSKTHVLVVPVRHVITPKKLYTNELIELFSIIIPWLEKELGISGMTALFRFGDTKKTGATIHHLHVHFIEGVEKSSPDHIPITAVVGFKSA